MLRYLRPKKIIEIGSGFSSCLMLDINEIFMGNRAKCTFIEPYPELLLTLLKDTDEPQIEIIPSRLQEVDPDIFSTLSASDILFIDSTDVSKVDSDVNHIFFGILPLLQSGVYIHFHDIFYPFVYPKSGFMKVLHGMKRIFSARFFSIIASIRSIFEDLSGRLFRVKSFSLNAFAVDYVGASIWLEKGSL